MTITSLALLIKFKLLILAIKLLITCTVLITLSMLHFFHLKEVSNLVFSLTGRSSGCF